MIRREPCRLRFIELPAVVAVRNYRTEVVHRILSLSRLAIPNRRQIAA